MTTLLNHTRQRLDILRELGKSPVPTTSVYRRAVRPGAGERDSALQWGQMREQLSAQGAPAENIAALTTAVGDLVPGDYGVAAFASEGELRLLTHLAQFDGENQAVHGSYPHATPLLRWQQQRLPLVAAVLRHGTAQAQAYDDDGQPVASETVIGNDDEIECNAPGGWAQGRFQRRAVDSWAHNAGEFVEHIERLADAVSARLLLLAGDIREVNLVLDRLPAPLRQIASTDVHARPRPDGATWIPDDELRSALRAAAEDERREALAALDDAVGRRLAVEGAADVGMFLQRGAVRTLIVVGESAGTASAGAPDIARTDAMVAAALDAESEIVVAEPGDLVLADGVAAILRF